MKEAEFHNGLHCGNCKRPLAEHPWEDDPIMGCVLRKFGTDCPYREVPFDPE